MAGVSAHGATFSFRGVVATVTGISVETPVAEVVNMTGSGDPIGHSVVVPTGDWSGGTISVDYIHAAGGLDPQAVVRQSGSLTFSSPGFSVTRTAILLSATTEARMGDVVRGNLKFQVTDYTGS